ncbi:putative movement protein [Stellaria aquatica mottle virus]|nr:putative movement protein [Stellaria aquatica mottle virus]
MLSANQNLIVVTGVIGLLLLIKSKLQFISIFDFASFAPVVTLNQIISLSFTGLLLNILARAERDIHYSINNDSSKQQHISINTPNGR